MRKPRILARLLGRASVVINGEEVLQSLPAKSRELFCYLVLNRARQHRREALANLLWADHPPDLSKKYLRQSLWRLHEIFAYRGEPHPGSIIDADHEWVTFAGSTPMWIDIAELESTSILSLQPPVRPNLSQVCRLTRAVTLYRGDLLEGCFSEWCSGERERFRQLCLSLLDVLISHCEAHQLLGEGLDYVMRSLTIDGARESTYRAGMRLLWVSGDRTSALRFYDRCAAVIRKEFGVNPEVETENLVQEIRAGGSARSEGAGSYPGGRGAGNHIFRRRKDAT